MICLEVMYRQTNQTQFYNNTKRVWDRQKTAGSSGATVQHNSENIMVWKCFPVLGQGNMQSLIQVWTTP